MNLQVVQHNSLTWTNIEKPTPQEMDYLREHYPFFHPLDLEDCLSRQQRPKIDEYDNYLFIVMHFPVFDKTSRRLGSSEVNIFVGRDFLVTVHEGSLKPLPRDFARCYEDEAARQKYMGRGSNYLLYMLIDGLVDYCLPILDKESQNTEAVEERIFGADAREVVREISVVRRNLINFRRIIHPQMTVISLLEHKDWEFLRGDLEVYWGNISDHIGKIWDRLEDLKEVIEGLGDTADSLSSHRLNEVIKYLTVISIIFGFVAAVSGIYGMNLSWLPLADSPYAFLLLIGTIFLVVWGMVFYFRRANWL